MAYFKFVDGNVKGQKELLDLLFVEFGKTFDENKVPLGAHNSKTNPTTLYRGIQQQCTRRMMNFFLKGIEFVRVEEAVPSAQPAGPAPIPAEPVAPQTPFVQARVGKSDPAAGPLPTEVKVGAAVGFMPPQTYAAAVVRAINADKTRQAQAEAKNRKAMALRSKAVSEAKAAEKEAALLRKWGPGYMPPAERKARQGDGQIAARKGGKVSSNTLSQAGAAHAHKFIKWTSAQMNAHQKKLLELTGGARWFSAAERKAFKAMSAEDKAAARLRADELARKIRADKHKAQQALVLKRSGQLCRDRKAHHWAIGGNAVCIDCGWRGLCKDVGRSRHEWSKVSKPNGTTPCVKCSALKPCSHNAIGPDYRCLSCGEQRSS